MKEYGTTFKNGNLKYCLALNNLETLIMSIENMIHFHLFCVDFEAYTHQLEKITQISRSSLK